MFIVENTASKRKTHTQVAFVDKRLFQLNTKDAFIKNPDSSFSYILPMLGKQLNSSEFQKFIIEFKQQDINWIIADNNRNSLGVYMPNKNLTFTLEELVAMILMDARAMAEKMAQEKVTDCVITVSPEFDAFQRMALKDAVEISGLRALSFINENMAASIRYSIDGHIATNDSLVMYINSCC